MRKYAEITELTKNFIFGRLRQRRTGKPLVEAIAILLDNEPAGFVEFFPPRRGFTQFRIALPTDRLAGSLDLVELPGSRTLLPSPYDLSPYYRLAMENLVLDGLKVKGWFTISADLDELLYVHLARDCIPIPGVYARRKRRNLADAVYAYEAPVPNLAALDSPYTLTARVAGAATASAVSLQLDHARLGFAGYIQESRSDAVLGWAVNLRDPVETVALELIADGAVVGAVAADEYRDDLAAIGWADGKSGFNFAIPSDIRGDGQTLGVVLAGTETHLVNSPIKLRSPSRLMGHFDGIQDQCAIGWAGDLDAPDDPVEIEILCENRVIAIDRTRTTRGDVQAAGFPLTRCGFRIDFSNNFRSCLGKEVSARIHGMTSLLLGSPHIPKENPNIGRFLNRSKTLAPRVLTRLKRHLNYRSHGQAISIVMPVYNTPKQWLIQALDSVRDQWCDAWELICIDDGSTEPHIQGVLASYAATDRRIRVLSAERNGGIPCATNFGIRAARFPYITFMDHDDLLEPDAVYRLLCAIRDSDADLVYSDELIVDWRGINVLEVRARPSFSYDYYLSHPYFVHLICVRASIARGVGGWDESMPISSDVDFVLRVLEVTRRVAHVPSVLYRWRSHKASAGHSMQAEVMTATAAALRRHLERRGLGAEVREGPCFNHYRIDWPVANGQILIIIPTRDRHELLVRCIESIQRTSCGVNYRIVVIDHESQDPKTHAYLRRLVRNHVVMPYKGPFNFSAMNNLAVRQYGGEASYVLFLNNDIEALEFGWLQRLASLAQRLDVGAVGSLLLYPDRTVQHAGVIVGFNKAAGHAMQFQPSAVNDGTQRNPGFNGTLVAVREFSAVTAACLMVRREVFEAVGGFDETFAIGFNDTDFCLRVRAAGLKVLYDGYSVLLHVESASRSEAGQILHPEDAERLRARWARYFADGDPFYHPVLDHEVTDHALRQDAGCKHRPVARVSAGPVKPPTGAVDSEVNGPGSG